MEAKHHTKAETERHLIQQLHLRMRPPPLLLFVQAYRALAATDSMDCLIRIGAATVERRCWVVVMIFSHHCR
jgi:hypothetical protein